MVAGDCERGTGGGGAHLARIAIGVHEGRAVRCQAHGGVRDGVGDSAVRIAVGVVILRPVGTGVLERIVLKGRGVDAIVVGVGAIVAREGASVADPEHVACGEVVARAVHVAANLYCET